MTWALAGLSGLQGIMSLYQGFQQQSFHEKQAELQLLASNVQSELEHTKGVTNTRRRLERARMDSASARVAAFRSGLGIGTADMTLASIDRAAREDIGDIGSTARLDALSAKIRGFGAASQSEARADQALQRGVGGFFKGVTGAAQFGIRAHEMS